LRRAKASSRTFFVPDVTPLVCERASRFTTRAGVEIHNLSTQTRWPPSVDLTLTWRCEIR
jgi:hypothetical protein